MSDTEVGVNTWAAADKGAQAEAMAGAMVGLTKTFSALMDDLAGKAGWISSGYLNFKFNLEPDIETVQRNGIALADGIQDGASNIAKNDFEAGEGFTEAWPDMPPVNF